MTTSEEKASGEEEKASGEEVAAERATDVAGLLPLDTSPDDWRLYPLPTYIRLLQVGPYAVRAHNVKPVWLFGTEEARVLGAPVRLTDPERTLLDGLRFPKYCGGLGEVFRAWVRALGGELGRRLDADRLVAYAERFDQRILYQRLGLVLETLGVEHPRLDVWKREQVVRGGSRLLDADRPYAPDYSEAWGLSINYPLTILAERDASTS